MARKSRQFLQGILVAMTEVAEITGKQKMEGMSDREWKLICELHARLAGLAAAECTRLEAQ